MKKCCGFCTNYCHVGDGVTVYRNHIVQIGYCPKRGETLEEMDQRVLTHDPIYGNWDEEYRWTSHTACNEFCLNQVAFNDPVYSHLKTL